MAPDAERAPPLNFAYTMRPDPWGSLYIWNPRGRTPFCAAGAEPDRFCCEGEDDAPAGFAVAALAFSGVEDDLQATTLRDARSSAAYAENFRPDILRSSEQNRCAAMTRNRFSI